MLQQEIDRHHLGAELALPGEDAQLAALGPSVDGEHLGDGGAGDVRVQDGGGVAPPLHQGGQHGGHQGFADASLSADYRNDLADIAVGIGGGQHAFRRGALGAVLAAALAVVTAAFTHVLVTSFRQMKSPDPFRQET